MQSDTFPYIVDFAGSNLITTIPRSLDIHGVWFGGDRQIFYPMVAQPGNGATLEALRVTAESLK